ncbi:MAG TPA: isoprenylcysteine carboxylmethyltransferase family protein [Spirochaetota bacterium]|nr:isoprenylcysteine carboxylmethyltransferase family protein [Spirochaetota bacterium]
MRKILYLIKSIAGISFFFVFMFAAAGTLRFPRGWLLFGISMIGLALNFIVIMRNDDLMNERSSSGRNAKPWDKKILGAYALLTLISYITAGLDAGRFHWSPDYGLMTMIPGIALILTGSTLFMLARMANNFFSSVARIQKERNHCVCSSGIYRVVRHPGYLGMILSLAGFPLVTGSAFSFIPVLPAMSLLVLRTILEDRMLHDELDGYAGYSRKTRYRLIPFIW